MSAGDGTVPVEKESLRAAIILSRDGRKFDGWSVAKRGPWSQCRTAIALSLIFVYAPSKMDYYRMLAD